MPRLPYWLLRLLPDWMCPKCKQEIKVDTRICIFCGYQTTDNKFIRVSPDKEMLSRYVHKKIMPKVDPIKRMIIAKFFTEFLNDGFESNNFNAWDGTGGAGTRETLSVNPHHGIYHAHFQCTLAQIQAYCYYNNGWALNESLVYTRIYILFKEYPDVTWREFGITHRGTDGNTISYTGLTQVDSDWVFILYGKNIGVDESDTGTTPLSLETYYCLELKTLIHASAGEHILYLNGSIEASLIGKDTDNYDNVQSVEVGITYAGNDSTMDLYVDCCIIADARIGCEWVGTISGVTNPGTIAGISVSNISTVKGVVSA